ncbi:uncharacterized protein ACN427_007355 [Glossina fuscipes fuscipes]
MQVFLKFHFNFLIFAIIFVINDYVKSEAEIQSDPAWKLYSNPQYDPPWCPFINFRLIGMAKDNGTKTWLGGICYKQDNIALYDIFFKMSPNGITWDTQGDDWKLQENNLTSLFKRTKWLTESGIENDEHAKFWWTFRHMEHNPIIQNEWPDHLKNQLKSALEICWWAGLRLGNWHKYQKALQSYIASGTNAHILLGGTLGERVPEELADISIESVCHLYIYEYVEPLNTHDQPIFVFGYNSPFADFYNRSEIVFCPDICSEIPWLSSTWQTFNYSTMGIMFCCTVDEVKRTHLHLNVDEINVVEKYVVGLK